MTKRMSKPQNFNYSLLERIACVLMVALLVVAGLPLFKTGKASAAQLSSRSIQLTDSGNSGGTITTGVGSGTAVKYQVSFTTSAAASSLVIDFCSTSPLISDTCTAPAGLVTTGATLVGVTGNITTAGWTISTPSASQIKVALGTGSAATAGAQIFRVDGITNPSAVGSYYARITTYTNATFGTYASATSPGNYVDYGGVAMSTTNTITITARVQEQLTFCVTAADPDTWTGGTAGDCAATQVAASPPAITIGHGGPPKVLDQTAVDFANVWSQLTTNASKGAVINMRNNNLTCTHPGAGAVGGGLSSDGGTTCNIPAANAGSATPAALTAGTAAFGMHATTYVPAVSAGAIGSVTPTAPYNDGVHVSASSSAGNTPASTVFYGMDNATATGPSGGSFASYNGAVSGLFGSSVATTTAPVYRADNRYTFAATAALTTPAGIYVANINMIATGTF